MGSDLSNMTIKQRIHRRARLLRLCLKALQNSDFLQRHTERPAATDEQESLHMFRFIGAVAIGLTIWQWKQTFALIETNGLNIRSCQL